MLPLLICAVFLVTGSLSDFDPSKHKNWRLLPEDTCGTVSTNRIIGGEEASENAYPWLARIGYSSYLDSRVKFRCGGALITSATVLTAAHCVMVPAHYKVDRIRLGDRNMKKDCESEQCNYSVTDTEPTEILIPNNYNSVNYKNDIALIRLNQKIPFSAFIKPICLPSGDLLNKNYVGSMTETAGWGAYDLDIRRGSDKLLTVTLPILDNEVCRKRLPAYTKVDSNQFCVGGIRGKDSCRGDSGGPLMKIDDGPKGPRYYILGIVSYGSQRCAETETPAVYTKIPSYMQWLLDNLNNRSSDAVKIL